MNIVNKILPIITLAVTTSYAGRIALQSSDVYYQKLCEHSIMQTQVDYFCKHPVYAKEALARKRQLLARLDSLRQSVQELTPGLCMAPITYLTRRDGADQGTWVTLQPLQLFATLNKMEMDISLLVHRVETTVVDPSLLGLPGSVQTRPSLLSRSFAQLPYFDPDSNEDDIGLRE